MITDPKIKELLTAAKEINRWFGGYPDLMPSPHHKQHAQRATKRLRAALIALGGNLDAKADDSPPAEPKP